MLSAAYLAFCDEVDSSDTIIVMPIDTYAGHEYYDCLGDLDAAVQSDIADLVLLGAKPTYPSEKFGYILPAEKDATCSVDSFIEKPSEDEARAMIERGALWNCGVFAFKLGYLMEVLGRYCPLDSFDALYEGYSALPKNSFDYEVVEKAESVAVVPYSGTWKDLGTWNTLTEEMSESCAGRVVCDTCCDNTHVINETGLPMVVAGMQDAVVVATPDGIIVSDKERSAHIKPLVRQVAETRPMYESRQWGEYKVLDQERYSDGTSSLEKMLVVMPGKQLSYQRHTHRQEIWTVLCGQGELVMDGKSRHVSKGDVISIPTGTKHAVRAISEMHVLEIQLGPDLVEDDIERLGYYWDSE